MPLVTRRDVGQLLIGSMPGASVGAEWRSLAREFDCGGMILFDRNIEAAEQAAELAVQVQALGRSMPAWVSVDQEGGRVARLRTPFTEWPPMATLGRSGSEALATRFARALGAELRGVGVTLNFAPVLDVHTNPKNPVIGDRALGGSAAEVARLGSAIVRGLQETGVAACGKHFPGHGDTAVDSHQELPVIEHPPDRLRALEFEPFRAAVAADVAFMMTAHVLVPTLDDTRPATLSPSILRLLRDELAFGGVIVSDDLEMKALTAHRSVPEAAVDAVRAGCDVVLVCSGDIGVQAATLEALVRALESGAISTPRWDDAFRRLRRAKERFLAGGTVMTPERRRELAQLLGRDEHQAIAGEMAAFL